MNDSDVSEIPPGFDNGQIISFCLPHYRIPEGNYPFKVGDKNGILIVKKIQKDYTDFETLTDSKCHVGAGGSIELIPDIYGINALSRIILVLEPGIKIEKDESISLEVLDKVYKSFALNILNQLVRMYRCFTQQFWVISVPMRKYKV